MIRRPIPLALLALLAACAPEGEELTVVDSSDQYVVEIQQVDFAYVMPTQIPSGWVTFRAPNEGAEHHVAVFLKLPEGVTQADWYEAMADPYTAREREWWAALEDAGGTGVVAPGGTAQTTIWMTPGLYGVICGVIAEDGTSHWVHGMHTTFEVTTENSGALEPVPDIHLALGSSGFEQEGEIIAGTRTVAVHFADQSSDRTHDVHVARLEEGESLESVIQLMSHAKEPFPVSFVGGAEQAPEGRTDYFTVTFEPGRYAWVCHLHAETGMAHEFVVH